MSAGDWITSLSASGSPYTISGVTASGGSVLTTGTNNWGTITAAQDLFPNTLDCKGDANFDGDLKIKGVSLSDTLSKIEERLAILHPNEMLESRWTQLKELGEQYRKLEQEILEKEQVWKILKK